MFILHIIFYNTVHIIHHTFYKTSIIYLRIAQMKLSFISLKKLERRPGKLPCMCGGSIWWGKSNGNGWEIKWQVKYGKHGGEAHRCVFFQAAMSSSCLVSLALSSSNAKAASGPSASDEHTAGAVCEQITGTCVWILYFFNSNPLNQPPQALFQRPGGGGRPPTHPGGFGGWWLGLTPLETGCPKKPNLT